LEDEISEGPSDIRPSCYIGVKNDPTCFKILSLNAQSINNKFQAIRDVTNDTKSTILAVQETWGRNATTDYSIVGFHRPEFRTRRGEGMNLGGGVAIWVRNDYDYETVETTSIDRICEVQAIYLPSRNVTIVNVYRPFGDIHTFFHNLEKNLDSIRTKLPSSDVVMVGDFNIDLSTSSVNTNRIIELAQDYDMLQTVTIPTRVSDYSSTIVDHVYISIQSNQPVTTDVIRTTLSDHYATLTSFTTADSKKEKISVTKRWLTSESYTAIATILGGEDWTPMVNLDCEAATDFLETKIIEALDLVAPIQTKQIKEKLENQWTTPGIKISLKHSQALYKTYRRTRSIDDKANYKIYNSILSRVIVAAKDKFYTDVITDAGNDSRQLWGILNRVVDRKQCKHRIPDRFIVNGENVRTKKKIATAFNAYFASIGKDMADSIPDIEGFEDHVQYPQQRAIQLKPLKMEEVQEIMKNQQPKMSSGIDTINNKIVKTCHEQLAYPMTLIINKSIEEQYVPTAYKKAKIVPLFKKGAANECGNYRPVSLLSALSKILEKAICKQLMAQLSNNNSICPDQFGFRYQSQTSHVVHKLLNEVSNNSVADMVTLATFIDLSKAFDCLQYDKLFYKLNALGLTVEALNWFKSYLTGRKQCVDIDGIRSDWLDVELGVPQGSILGPVLFLIYVNDINNADKEASYTKFADDTTIITSGMTLDIATTKMNSALSKLHIWFSQNKLNLNPSKTRYMIFNGKGTTETQLVKIDNQFIERVWSKGKETSFKLVGIQVDERLKWDSHISYISRKIGYANYTLNKARNTLSQTNKKLLYSGLIHSHLVYGAAIWGNASKGHLDKLLKQQKKAIRKIYNLRYRDHTNDYFIQANILKVPELMDYTTLSYIQSGLFERSPDHIRNLWNIKSNNLHILRDRGMQIEIPFTRKEWIRRLAPSAQAQLWNTVASKVEWDIDPIYFKKQLKAYFMSTYLPSEEA